MWATTRHEGRRHWRHLQCSPVMCVARIALCYLQCSPVMCVARITLCYARYNVPVHLALVEMIHCPDSLYPGGCRCGGRPSIKQIYMLVIHT